MAINGSALRAFSRLDFHSFLIQIGLLSTIGVRLIYSESTAFTHEVTFSDADGDVGAPRLLVRLLRMRLTPMALRKGGQRVFHLGILGRGMAYRGIFRPPIRLPIIPLSLFFPQASTYGTGRFKG